MVRKRSRTASSRRKTYDSDDDDLESDLDLSSSPPASPEPKRYGLRQRTKKTIFFEDYEDFEEPQKSTTADSSEDDDYEIEEDLKSLKTVNHKSRKSRLKITPRRKSIQLSMENDSIENVTVSVSSIQPIVENEPDQNLSDGLIDYEDMIRADVVVNKKLDEEVLIKSQQEVHESRKSSEANNVDKARRGRKPKNKHPSTNMEDEANLEVQIDPLPFVQTAIETEPRKTNGLLSPGRHRKKLQKSKIKLAPSIHEGIEKFVPPKLDEKEKEVVLSNEYLLGNSFDMTADQFLERQASKVEAPDEEEPLNLPPINFDECSSDDDVVIIEKKPEIIVLDDD